MVLSVLLYVRISLLLDWTGESGIVDIGMEKHQ